MKPSFFIKKTEKGVDDMTKWDVSKIKDDLSLLKKPHFTVIDIETTGFSPDKGGRIIEIAAVQVIGGEIKDTFHTLLDPQLKIPAKITSLTGVTNEAVKGKPTALEVLPNLYEFIGNSVVVCHNAQFDWGRFLLKGFQQSGIVAVNDVFCTLKFFRKVLPGRGRGAYTLDKMCEELNVPLNNHHQALDDTLATAKCFIEFLHVFSPESLSLNEVFSIEKPVVEHTPIKIKQVRYWEKKKNAREVFRRQYVRISNDIEYGTIYYDIPTRTWGNKDFPLPLDFEKVEKTVIRFLNLEKIDDLLHFRN